MPAQTKPGFRKPAGAEWPLVGGDWGNTRYSTQAKINTSNVKALKGAWMPPAATYEIDGEQYVAIAAGGSRDGLREARADLVWSFKIGGRVNPLNGPPAPPVVSLTLQ